MRKVFLAALAVHLVLVAPRAAMAQTARPHLATLACDLNKDGTIDILDMQLAVNMALGMAPCTANIISAGVCHIVMVERVNQAAATGSCITGAIVHSVTLSWTASTSSNITGYNVYRGTQANGPYTKINAFPVSGTSYTDTAAQAGQTYYYVTTAVDSSNNESAYSNQAQAVIPVP